MQTGRRMQMELKPCPFCGGKPLVESFIFGREKTPRFRVRCSKCWCETNWEFFAENEVAEAWNRRAD